MPCAGLASHQQGGGEGEAQGWAPVTMGSGALGQRGEDTARSGLDLRRADSGLFRKLLGGMQWDRALGGRGAQ